MAAAIDRAEVFDETSHAEDGFTAVVARLASLDSLEYDRERKAAAKLLRVRLGTLDTEVERARSEKRVAAPLEEVQAYLTDPEPWPDPVDGAPLVEDIVTAISRYLILPAGGADAVAAWVLHAHLHDTASISPILAITSPSPECGKTTLLELLGTLVPRPLPTSNITAASLFRAVEKWRPTVLIDEADTFLSESEGLRGVLNSGHRRAAAFVVRTVGEDYEPRQFMTWAPKVIALIGKLPATLASRSIEIALRRKTVHEKVEELRHDRVEHLDILRRRCARFAKDIASDVRKSDPLLPPGLHGRSADNWRHLVAIADIIGGDFSQRIRNAATSSTARRAEQTAGIMLLQDIRALFSERGADRLPSTELAAALGKMEDRPWSEWKSGAPITVRQIARLLEPFGVAPTKFRVTGYTPGTRGYEFAAFSDAFDRYLSDPPMQSATTPQARDSADFHHSHPPHGSTSVAHANGQGRREAAGCGAVADRNATLEETPDEELLAAFDERAGFLEADAGLSRAEAEARAAEDLGLIADKQEAAE